MVHVASEMQRHGIRLPLMIGGATTSKAHTAAKITPQFQHDLTSYLPDASPSVGVATRLLSQTLKPILVTATRSEYEKIRQRHEQRRNRRTLLSYQQALDNAFKADGANYPPLESTFTGVRVFENLPLAQLTDHIDWTPFFITWDLADKFPAILTDEVVGTAATSLYQDARHYEQAGDDYSSIMVKALADRLTEAFAEARRWLQPDLVDRQV